VYTRTLVKIKKKEKKNIKKKNNDATAIRTKMYFLINLKFYLRKKD